VDDIEEWWSNTVGADWRPNRDQAMALLQRESELQEIVQLVGPDALPEIDQVTLETTRMLREDYLGQNAFDDVDTYCPPQKQHDMLKVILSFQEKASEASKRGANIKDIVALPVKDKIARMKYVPAEEFEAKAQEIEADISKECSEV
jgi:V/A-type H+-transporting ATPase subunit A